MANLHQPTVSGFGVEWTYFDQSGAPQGDLDQMFENYFSVFPWDKLPAGAVGVDVGCGSGRWAKRVAGRVGTLHCLDASADALAVAERNLADQPNCKFHVASVDQMPFADGSLDFGYSLGVLHHVPDTAAAIRACVAKLKPGAPFLLYLYYAFDNRPLWFRNLWRLSDLGRRFICQLGPRQKLAVTSAIAATVYLPLARTARLVERLGLSPELVPLAYYRNHGFYTLRTDAFDRFATSLERRFTAAEIEQMMTAAGLERIVFRQGAPYWCAVGSKRQGGGSTTTGA